MVAGEARNPGLGAAYINNLVAEGRAAFREHFRLLMVNAMQDGYLWFTEPLTPAERQSWLLSAEADQQVAEQIQDPDASVRAQAVELTQEITEARNGQSQIA